MNQSAQTFLKILIGITILAGGTMTLMILTSNNPSDVSSKLMAICFLFLFYGITGSTGMAAAAKKEHSILGTAGVIVSAVAFLFSSILIIGEVEETDMLKFAFSLSIAAIALAHICFLFHITTQNKYAFIARIIATIFISLFSLLVIAKIFEAKYSFFFWERPASELYLRMVFASLVMDITATLLVPLCNRIHTGETNEFVITSEPVTPVADETEQAS